MPSCLKKMVKCIKNSMTILLIINHFKKLIIINLHNLFTLIESNTAKLNKHFCIITFFVNIFLTHACKINTHTSNSIFSKHVKVFKHSILGNDNNKFNVNQPHTLLP